jgi:hypothetical protein
MSDGMNTEMDRDHDRNKWHLAIAKRNYFVELLKGTISKKRAHSMRISDLEREAIKIGVYKGKNDNGKSSSQAPPE